MIICDIEVINFNTATWIYQYTYLFPLSPDENMSRDIKKYKYRPFQKIN